MFTRIAVRRFINSLFMILISLAMAGMLIIMFSLLWTLVSKGFVALDMSLFTQPLSTPNSSGGLANAIVGSLIITGIAILISAPVGLLIATYLAEYGQHSQFANMVRFFNDKLLSAPSIIIGLFVYVIVVRTMGSFSAIAGSLALAVIALPIIIRVSEDALALVDNQVREAAIALGIKRYKVIIKICYRAAARGVATGVLLAFARIAGETAPLLFTALNNQFWNTNLTQPMANLPVVIYQYAMSPYANWQQLAWSGALLITTMILVISIIAKYIESRSEKKHVS